MTDAIRPARTETFEHTISGLLTKRADLSNEIETLRDRLAAIVNDIAALDRVLRTLGYVGDLAAMPRLKRPNALGEKGSTRQILAILREAQSPLTSREVGKKLMETCGQDVGDRKALADRTNLASRILRRLREQDSVLGDENVDGRILWSLHSNRAQWK